MTTTDTRVAPWPGLPQTCPAWCEGLHRAGDMHDDRWHTSANAEFAVTSLVPLGDEPGWVYLYLRQHVDQREPHVRLEDDNGAGRGYELRLTLDEAQRMGARLLDLATRGAE